jgi:hypothetical protein
MFVKPERSSFRLLHLPADASANVVDVVEYFLQSSTLQRRSVLSGADSTRGMLDPTSQPTRGPLMTQSPNTAAMMTTRTMTIGQNTTFIITQPITFGLC